MTKLFFFILIFIGIMLRVTAVDQVPAGLFADEVSIAVNAKTIAENGVDEYGRTFPFAFESLSDYKLPGYIYATAFFYKFFGPTILSVRITAVLASIVSLFLVGYLAQLLFPQKKNIFLYAGCVLALCLYHIHFSRIAYETMLATMFMLVYFIAFIKVLTNIKKNVWLWIFVGGIAAILSIWTYPAPKFIIPTFTIGMLLFVLVTKQAEQKKRAIFYGLLFLGIIVLSFVPSALDPNIDKRPLKYLAAGANGSLLESIWQKSRDIFISWFSMWNLEFLFAKGDVFAFRHGTKETGVFLSIFLLPLILGFVITIKQFSIKQLPWFTLLLLTVLCGLPSALTSSTPYGPRFLPMMIPFTLILALGFDVFVNYLKKRSSFQRIVLVGGIMLIFIYQLLSFMHAYLVHYKRDSLPEFPEASKSVALLIKQHFIDNPTTPVYFLDDRNCRAWSHDDLHLWYFADLDNQKMIAWNNVFRVERYQGDSSPFNAYEHIIPQNSYGQGLFMYARSKGIEQAKSKSLIIRCAVHLPNINLEKETIKEVIYLYPAIQLEPFYVVSEKK